MITAEVALYPLKTNDASTIINSSLQALEQNQIEYTVGSMSTYLQGSEEEVWQGLKTMFSEAQHSGEVSMVVTISNSAQ